MKSLLKIYWSFLLLLVFSCSRTDDKQTTIASLDPAHYFEAIDVSYGEHPHQKFDIYLPANRNTNTKVMVLIHGGGWSSGDKENMNAFKDFIRIEHPDVAIVNLNYRLANDENKPYPMQIDDITGVINYLKDNKVHYTISDDFGFIGVSAGAHLSLLWSYAFDTHNNAKMVCSIVGPTNFTDPAYLNSTDTQIRELLDLYGENATIAFLEEVSPYHQVTASAPPTILFYGGQDPLVPTTQGIDMSDRLETLGVTHEFTLYPNEGHVWVGSNLLDTGNKLKAFIENYLK
jgi:acetyl esterase/lipase